jgi:ADP-ribose pyrophosphatase YjhB (NUDIX family)
VSPRVRVTGVQVEEGCVLLCQQRVTASSSRVWSLPGGTLELGESIAHCLLREMKEETGLIVKLGSLLYVADRIQDGRHIVHITFLVHRVAGELKSGHEPEAGANQIYGVEFIPLRILTEYGFSRRFQELALNGFPSAGSYQGAIAHVGL